ncbi:MAG: Xaa-Pro peptidase family protein [Treponema sp.]|nr:Xaa-Pro peptidase family protein [Treponema sp.]
MNILTTYQKRREKLYDWMAREGIALVMIEDFEERRNPAVRWLTGQPGDALLFLSADRRSLLAPWDINMAAFHANADILLPYSEFDRRPVKALRGAAEYLKIPKGSRVEIPRTTSYPRFLNFVEEVSDFDIICREGGIWAELEKSRAVKDESEIKIYHMVSALTDEIINLLEKNIQSGKLKTEIDVALFIDSEARKRGCEGTGFETLAAGPGRSFGIHAFPAYTGGSFGGKGLSILDFGLKYAGYTSDVTLTIAVEPLSKTQEKMVALTEKAYKLALSMVKNGAPARNISTAVDAYFARYKKNMPHALGHGIGLEAHEAPFLRSRADNDWILEPGMIITLEPGLYDPVHGGCRLENDILITETDAEVLTSSRIIRF